MSGAIIAAGSAANTAALNANQAVNSKTSTHAFDMVEVAHFLIAILFLFIFCVYLELVVRGFLMMISNVWDLATDYEGRNKKIRLWWLIYTLLIALFASLMIYNIGFCGGFVSKIYHMEFLNFITAFTEVLQETLPAFTISSSILFPLAIVAFIVINVVRYIKLKKEGWYSE